MKKLILMILVISLISVVHAEDIRIACIGNSITAYHSSYPIIDPDSYPVLLDILLGDGYDARNFGVSGRTLLKHGDYPIWNEDSFVDALEFNPNIVTILLGTNDSKPQNWAFKDEFIPDYIAMIDTFRSLESHPDIYVCLPPKAFSSKYDITDSVIINDMIPMINQIAQEKNTPIIDFYAFFSDKSYLSYDGIHPTMDGLWEYAKIFYAALNPNAKEIEEIKEVNLALNKTIVGSISSDFLADVVDGNIHSACACKDGESIVLDLGSVDSTDMFQIIFNGLGNYGYKIETSVDNTNWTTMIDSSARQDTINVAIEGIDPVEIQYIRYTFKSVDQTLEYIPVAELRVLKTALIHAPVITYNLIKTTATIARFEVIITSSIKGGYLKYYSSEDPEVMYTGRNGYRHEDELTRNDWVRDGVKCYVAKFYKDGYEVTSDTVKIDLTVTDVKKRSSHIPMQFSLHQNYPNPFNPETMINYQLAMIGEVDLSIYNQLGQKVATLVSAKQSEGNYNVRFDGSDLVSGIYFCRLNIRSENGVEHKQVKKMVLLK